VPTPTTAPADFLPFAHTLADAAGAVLRRYFRTPVAVDRKADASPVTVADREAERAMRALIRDAFPEHGIEGEEDGAERGDAPLVWSLDPIDGTKSFITGRPLFGTLISLVRAGRPVLGVIDQCILGERWVGVEGRPSLWNADEIRVRPCPDLYQAVLYATSPDMFPTPAERAAFARVAAAARQPMYGGDCYAYGLLAMGFADVIVEAGLQAHDFCALVPVIEGAGGVMTDWEGRPLTAASDGRVVAAGDERVLNQTLTLLNHG
jgi:inositol-phosphate phosphatase / L-galactose 1-phosphate phosphatase / histidinol-phosphatase